MDDEQLRPRRDRPRGGRPTRRAVALGALTVGAAGTVAGAAGPAADNGGAAGTVEAGSGSGAGATGVGGAAGGNAGSASSSAVGYQAPATGGAPALARTTAAQAPTVLTLDKNLHAARRASWGLTPALVKQVKQLGAAAWLERQLKPTAIADASAQRLLAPFDTLGMTPAQLKALNKQREKKEYFYAHLQLESAAFVRAAFSERQLLEVMVDFWHSRLHVPAHLDKTRDTLNHYDVNVIRRHALGTFNDMVWAMVTHPAMIVYLDNQENTKDGGNQNLGRELLELHTLGVTAGYTQADVEGAAKLLTGLSVDGPTGAFVYRANRHATGAVKVFGKTYPNRAAADGLAAVRQLVRDLTHHPKTAHYLAHELCLRLVSDNPSARLVAKLAAVYLKAGTAITPVLRALFADPEFATGVGAKYRRPLEFAVASVRTLGLRPGPTDQFVRSLADLRWYLDGAGQTPLGRNTPDGYPDFARPWLSATGTLARWNLAMALVGGWHKGLTKPDVTGMIGSARTYGAAVEALARRLQHQPATPAQTAALLGLLGKSAGAALTPAAIKDDYALQVHVPALILAGPHHQLR